jgi:hypothetical protein
MIEVIRHSLGLCGEGHVNIFTLLLSGVGLSTPLSYVYYKLKFRKGNDKG